MSRRKKWAVKSTDSTLSDLLVGQKKRLTNKQKYIPTGNNKTNTPMIKNRSFSRDLTDFFQDEFVKIRSTISEMLCQPDASNKYARYLRTGQCCKGSQAFFVDAIKVFSTGYYSNVASLITRSLRLWLQSWTLGQPLFCWGLFSSEF